MGPLVPYVLAPLGINVFFFFNLLYFLCKSFSVILYTETQQRYKKKKKKNLSRANDPAVYAGDKTLSEM